VHDCGVLSPGHVLRQYRIERTLGQGGMGEVYLATDTKLRRLVALKILPHHVADDVSAKRFIREAIAASHLNHPNISVVHDADQTEDGLAFIVMEYIEGETLAERLRRGPLGIEEIEGYALQIADALDEAHRHGILHRDIKPANVMIGPNGRVKVLDFGLARVFDDERARLGGGAITQTIESGNIAGTPPYMSPEQACGEPLDQRSDIFSFGVLLYESVTGVSPFAAPSAAATFARVLKTDPPPLTSIRSDVPPHLEAIVAKMIAKDREARYQSARDVALDLKGIGSTARGLSRRLLVGVPVVLLAGVLAALVWTRARPSAPASPAIHALAVLPFQDLSSAQEEYLADGMTEALIAALAQIKALSVISRTSVMQYKKTAKSLPQIARELGADGVIEGSIVHVGDRVRVTAQLIDARRDRHLWAQSYDRDERDILRLQDEIARAVADEMRIQLLPAEKNRLSASRQIDPRAHDLYVRGRYAWNQRGLENLLASIGLLNQAIAIEPAWPLAYAALADAYNLAANNSAIPHAEGYPKGRAAARKALELDPNLGQAHAALAFGLWQFDHDWDAAGDEFRRAIELEPGVASTHHFYALYLSALGRDEEALSEIRKALELDPLAPRINTNYGDILRSAGHEEAAIVQLQNWIAADPFQALRSLVWAHVHRHESVRALEVARRADSLHAPAANALTALATASLRGRAALPFVREMAADPRNIRVESSGYTIGAAYFLAGDTASGWRWMRRAAMRNPGNTMFLREPVLAPQRADPRWRDILTQFKLR
jgi:TolB-like protein